MRETPCFPEPATPDPTWAAHREDFLSWLIRSTTDRATDLRAFMNRNLSELPTELGAHLCKELHTKPFLDAHLELIVARVMQVLGAGTFQYEVPNSEGRNIDLVATFADGVVGVESTVPRYNPETREIQRDYSDLIALIERLAPAHWWIWVRTLPRIGPNDRKGELRQRLTTEFASLPADATAPQIIHLEFDQGLLELELRAGRMKGRAVQIEPGVAFFTDAVRRIRDTIVDKRPQARGRDYPVLLAIRGEDGSPLEDFDNALFGRTFERLDTKGRVAERGFLADGIFASGAGTPTFAGLLAFTHLEYTQGVDPVLYAHLRFRGTLPAAFGALRRRSLPLDGLCDDRPQRAGVLAELSSRR